MDSLEFEMPKREWLNQRIREIPGGSKAGLARAMGVPAPRVHEIIRGVRSFAAREIEPAARYLDWTVNQLLEAISSNWLPADIVVMPVVGTITTSGNVRLGEHLISGGSPPLIEVPPMPKTEGGPLAALAVDTDDLEQRYSRGDYVFFIDPGETDWRPLVGVECVVKRPDGTLAVRVIQKNPDGTPLLVVPFRNVVEPGGGLIWASPIRHVTRIIKRAAVE